MSKNDPNRLSEILLRIRRFNENLAANRGDDLAAELRETRERVQRDTEPVRKSESFEESLNPDLEALTTEAADRGSDLALETIVLRTGRPVLAIARNEPKLKFQEKSESEFWKARLSDARSQLIHAIKATGRVELENNPRFSWVGTGWLVKPTVIVTNRHVANEFAVRRDGSFVFQAGTGGQMRASLDFLEESGSNDSLVFRVKKVLYIEPDNGPDVAFLEVDPKSNSGLAEPVTLASSAPESNRFVATIGYPAKDSRIPEQDLMEHIFGNVFNTKRLAPGQVTRTDAQQLQHDCSTLGGNSGSVVLDLASGEALALHFGGRFLEANFAVPAPLVASRLEKLKSGVVSVPGSLQPPVSRPVAAGPPQGDTSTEDVSTIPTLTCTVPVTFTIQVGTPVTVAAAGTQTISARARVAETEELIIATEAPPESYANREGFHRDFLGDQNIVELPTIGSAADQIVTFDLDGSSQSELKYQHFSVVMNAKRRMCFFSAGNADGQQSKRTVRAAWRFDSRIPQQLQIMKECYGNAPKFSRGHMTRREDPAWGDRDEANLGNEDSMHVTNTVPQMQTFNGGIWLSLEDFALQNAREDNMRISVITGPFLNDSDPVQFGVKIPVEFWKVIAFIHDKTGELTATGYSISQEDQLSEQEFVFGEFRTFQRPLLWIEQKAGISFGTLSQHDPLAGTDLQESVPVPLARLDEIRFVR